MTPDSGDTNSKNPNTPNQELSDDELLAQLRLGQSETDPPPPHLAEVAMRALTWDLEFAELVAAAVTEEPVLVRGAATTIDLAFEVEGCVLEVAVEPLDDQQGFRLSGMVHPRQDHVLVVSPGNESVRAECDSFGRFDVVASDEPMALAFELPDGRIVRTELLDLP